ncbi:galactokinase [Treponema ruminis]|uniref:Galactokinase n=1 Tax=Treponema ruminis TaxID=744515 RepID=A0A7W8G7L6_9SPIR|nr:galactokinase family protein [Treponema ruminis]MBB5225339.1 galactokinase [Treponema ruminis]QSI01790.1 galactokinase [Treponema ruminis]
MDLVKDIHKSEYGQFPDVVVCTPGRFHLIGEHSWFFRDKTLSMGVNLPVYVAVSFRDDAAFHFYFPQLKDRKKISMLGMKYRKEDRWANSIKAMIYGFTSGGFEIKGMNFTIYSDILPSAGFGINTAMKVGSAYAINELQNLKCDEPQILQAMARGNLRFLNSNHYLSDILAAIHSDEKSLVLTDHATKSCQLLPFDYPEKKIILVDTKVPRVNIWNEEIIREPESALLLGELKDRKSYVKGGWRYEENPHEVNLVLSIAPEMIHKKLNSIIKEHQYVLDAWDGLDKGSFGKFARAVNHSHENMRDEYEISCPEIDWVLKRLSEINPNNDDSRNPFNCGRITGKGFGRCLYAILDEKDVPEFNSKLSEFTKIFGFRTSSHIVEPAKGVSIVS